MYKINNKMLLNLIACAMIFGWTSKSYAYDYVVIGAEIVTAVTAVTLTSGAVYQYFSTQKDKSDYPAPGKMVDVGGYKLHINCTGSGVIGQPTVVLDAGLGGYSLDWMKVQPAVEKFSRVCSYDRAGYGWSDESPNPRTSKYIVRELHKLLKRAGEQGPFIMVGHSFGGINVRVFANKYPEQVAGVVLVDAPHEYQESKLPKEPPPKSFISRLPHCLLEYPQVSSFLTSIGVTRMIVQKQSFDWYPEDIRNSCRANASTAKFIRAMYQEERLHFQESLEQLKELDSNLNDTPLIVITAGKPCSREDMTKEWAEWQDKRDVVWLDLQKDLAAKSTNSLYVLAQKSGHMIPSEQPEIIVDALNTLFTSVLLSQNR